MDPAANAGAPLAAVAAGQRVWVRLSADASRAHGPALLMRLLDDRHPDALAAGAADPSAAQQPTAACAQPPQEAGGMAEKSLGIASYTACSAGEAGHGLEQPAANADAKQQQALPPPAAAAAPGGRREAHPTVSATPATASSPLRAQHTNMRRSEWDSGAGCTSSRWQQQRQQQQQQQVTVTEPPAKYSIAQALAQALGQAMLSGATPSGLEEVAESGGGTAAPDRLCMRAHLLPRHPPQCSIAATAALVRSCRSATCPCTSLPFMLALHVSTVYAEEVSLHYSLPAVPYVVVHSRIAQSAAAIYFSPP